MSKARQRREAEQRKKLERRAETDMMAAVRLAAQRRDSGSVVAAAMAVRAAGGREPPRSDGAKKAISRLEPRLMLLNEELEEDSSELLRSMLLTATVTESGHLHDCECHWAMDPRVQEREEGETGWWLMKLAKDAMALAGESDAVGVVVASVDVGPIGLVVLACDRDGWCSEALQAPNPGHA